MRFPTPYVSHSLAGNVNQRVYVLDSLVSIVTVTL
jgi:hypothetical protein